MSNNKDFKVKNGIKPTVYHEAVGTVVSGSLGFSIASASYDSVSFSVASQDSQPVGLSFNANGTKMFMIGFANDNIYQYSLSTAYDVSTASYDSVSFSILSQAANAESLTFKPDGTKMYVVSRNNGIVYQYSLSTAYDLSTASYDSVSFSVNTQEPSATSAIFNSNGTKMYVVGRTNDTVYQYSLSTAYDISTASYDSVSLSVSSQETVPEGLAFNLNGSSLFVAGRGAGAVFQYTLSTNFDLSTATYSGVSFSITSQDTALYDIVFSNTGTKMYVLGNTNDTIYQYSTALTTAELDLSTGSVFDYTPTSDVQVTLTNPAASGTSSGATLLLSGSAVVTYDIAGATYDDISFSVASQEGVPTDLSFKPDGTKMYVIGYVSDSVHEYNLSTAWDVSTSSFLQSFSVATQETLPTGISFKPDGTKMYVTGNNTKNVNEYNLSTAWDVSTAVYSQLFYVGTQATGQVSTLAFKPDGTKMYAGTAASDIIYEYDLSTAWDVSTSTYNQNLDVQTNVTTAYGLAFKPDGTRMYILDYSYQEVNEYELSTAWDISSGSYLREVTVNAAGQTQSWGLALSSDGQKLYVASAQTDTVYQYSIATPATITYDSTLQWPSGTAPTSPAIGETDVITFNTTDGGTTYKSALAIDGAK